MITGVIMPCWAWVAALNALQNSMMFTPRWPNAGPTGGVGFACPAGVCNLISPITFFAIFRRPFPLVPFDLHELELHRRRSPKDADEDSDFFFFGAGLFDEPIAIS